MVLKVLEGSVLLKSDISFVLIISLAGFNFSIKIYSFLILQIKDLIVKVFCFFFFVILQRSLEISGIFLCGFFWVFVFFLNSVVKSICLLLICKWVAISKLRWSCQVSTTKLGNCFFPYRFVLRDNIIWDCGFATFCILTEFSEQFSSELIPCYGKSKI